VADELIRYHDDLPEADRALVLKIRDALWDYEPLRGTRPVLDVQVEDGRVRLAGRMRTLAMKEVVEYLLLRIEGIRAVRNDVVADPEVVRAVADAFAADDRLGPAGIRIEARDGEVTLTGSVPDESLIARAESVAMSVPLVASVENRVLAAPERMPSANGTATAAPAALENSVG
jgi:osmotically-inducible protein OsmY